ncbi:uncharacterized protein At3g28850-like [Zingiber officinale]|uniref:Glutaredoxin domain-containing protein n=1 Tax=Zingiber officinale TaxID=94328 RepID=A0A8J5F258_ZINOF|nr:uncharacterized protein At3g28850-like [Zingiber officinale]KAG6477132.1 hypothetical protein ZIOFF_066384 [Zingiber officinale]
MGCVASKPFTDDLHAGIFFPRGFDSDFSSHVVSLTSTTYGALNLDRCESDLEEEEREVIKRECRRPPPIKLDLLQKSAGKEEPPEIIDARELMEDLADETPFWTPLKKQEKPQFSSPPAKQKRRVAGKENAWARPQESKRWDFDLSRILRPFSPSDNAKRISAQTPGKKRNLTPSASARDSGGSASRRSLSPVFDPDLLASLEREHLQDGGKIKKKVTLVPRTQNARDSALFLHSYEEKCPPGGKNKVVFYSTTLRGIRKTFENCNAVRSALESHRVQIGERDISMDSGYREELRSLMGSKELSIPVVFVKGRLIGGAEEVLKLEEEGKLGPLLEELPRVTVACEACAGVRFIMCMDCRGSCKVLDEEQKKMAKCKECNENGLIHCPICC